MPGVNTECHELRNNIIIIIIIIITINISSRCCGVSVVSLFHCTFHAWVGWVSEIKYGLNKLTSDLTQVEL